MTYAKSASVKINGKYGVDARVTGTPIEFLLEFENKTEIRAAYERSYAEGVNAYRAEGARCKKIAEKRLREEYQRYQKSMRGK